MKTGIMWHRTGGSGGVPGVRTWQSTKQLNREDREKDVLCDVCGRRFR